MARKGYVPEFSWKVHGSTVNYEQWIYDREEPIARFDSGLVEQPEQSLRYFNLVPRPLVLRRLKLTPDGPPLIEGLQLYWVLRRTATIAGTNSVATTRLTEFGVGDDDSKLLTMQLRGCDEGGMASSTTSLTVSYDGALGSYVYDVQSILEIATPEEFYAADEVSFEYSDPWFVDIPAPAVSFPGAWKGRFQSFVYEAPGGEVLQIPLNHVPSSQKTGVRLKDDGLFAAVSSPNGNPAFQLIGETARETVLSVCPWGYDVHFGLRLRSAREELSEPVRAHFRAFQIPEAEARRMEEAAQIPPLRPEEVPFSVVPGYERRCSFDKPCDADKPYRGLDRWPWVPLSGRGHAWDRTEGRSDGCSLRIEKEEIGLAQWGVQHEGAGGWMEPWTVRTPVRISCFVKTRNVEGIGSSIAARYNAPNEPDVYAAASSRRLKGTNAWTRLLLKLGPAPQDAYFIHIFLRQDGKGTTWFDDLRVEYVK